MQPWISAILGDGPLDHLPGRNPFPTHLGPQGDLWPQPGCPVPPSGHVLSVHHLYGKWGSLWLSGKATKPLSKCLKHPLLFPLNLKTRNITKYLRPSHLPTWSKLALVIWRGLHFTAWCRRAGDPLPAYLHSGDLSFLTFHFTFTPHTTEPGLGSLPSATWCFG